MHCIRREIVALLIAVAAGVIGWRAVVAVSSLSAGDETLFLAFPLAVIMPALAFGYLARRRGMASSEGALMQLGSMIHLLLILALPGFALYLALGFPVVFLAVELFETRLTAGLRDPLKRAVLA